MINDDELLSAIAEVQQPRSEFQLNYFVVGQHYTAEMQYYQVLLELNDMIFKHKHALLDVEIQKLKIKGLREAGDAISELEAQKLELTLEQTHLAILGSERELAHLYAMWKSAPNKYTRAEIEAGQAEYWQARLSHDVEMQAISGSVNPAHLTSMFQAGILEDFLSKNIQPEQTAPPELS